jgi:hypothetical protein
LNEPFQLIKAFDFDQTLLPTTMNPYPLGGANGESVPFNLVTKTTDAVMMYVDPDFQKTSSYIYTVCCVDAHGFTSNYSEQFHVSFNKFSNSLVKKRISSSGAPKPYPNLYLDSTGFVDSMVDKGHSSVTVVFNPDHLSVFNNARKDLKLLMTTKLGGYYRLLFINTDLQLEQTLDITIDDLRTFTSTFNRFRVPSKPGLTPMGSPGKLSFTAKTTTKREFR